MRLSPASRLSDRQIVWVGFRNDGTVMDDRHHGHPATLWAASFEDAFRTDVTPCPISGWVSQQG